MLDDAKRAQAQLKEDKARGKRRTPKPKDHAVERLKFARSGRWRLVPHRACYDQVRYLHPEDAQVWRIPFNLSFWVHGYAYVFPTTLDWETSLHARAVVPGMVFGSLYHGTADHAKASIYDALFGPDPVGLRRIKAMIEADHRDRGFPVPPSLND